MAVYVDIAIWERWNRRWCHLLADGTDELHAFAAGLGLKRSRFQSKPGRLWIDHYDIDEDRRREAVARGAIEITRREVCELLARKRASALAERSYAAGAGASPTAMSPRSSTSP